MDDDAIRHFQGWWEEHGSLLFPGIDRGIAGDIYIAGFGRGVEEAVRFQQAEPASPMPQ
jgi:hypothetical protein